MKRIKTTFLLCTLMLFFCSVNLSQGQRRQPIIIIPEEQGKNVTVLKPGEASGTIKGVGGIVRVRYAYARWVRDANNANEMLDQVIAWSKALKTVRN